VVDCRWWGCAVCVVLPWGWLDEELLLLLGCCVFVCWSGVGEGAEGEGCVVGDGPGGLPVGGGPWEWSVAVPGVGGLGGGGERGPGHVSGCPGKLTGIGVSEVIPGL
jgi:hypothetical protein